MSVVDASEGSLEDRPDGSADLAGLTHLEWELAECWLLEDDLGWSDGGESWLCSLYFFSLYISSPSSGR